MAIFNISKIFLLSLNIFNKCFLKKNWRTENYSLNNLVRLFLPVAYNSFAKLEFHVNKTEERRSFPLQEEQTKNENLNYLKFPTGGYIYYKWRFLVNMQLRTMECFLVTRFHHAIFQLYLKEEKISRQQWELLSKICQKQTILFY